MPRIVQFHRLGGPEVLEIEDVPSSEPSSGEVTLRVQAIGLNRAESMFMHGYYLEPPRLPARLGYEASGTVTAIGPDVDPRWLCKNVSTIPTFSPNCYGVLGTEVIVPVHAVAEYPSHLTAIEATSIWMQYMTAYGALVELGRLNKGEFALITAASSSENPLRRETLLSHLPATNSPALRPLPSSRRIPSPPLYTSSSRSSRSRRLPWRHW